MSPTHDEEHAALADVRSPRSFRRCGTVVAAISLLLLAAYLLLRSTGVGFDADGVERSPIDPYSDPNGLASHDPKNEASNMDSEEDQPHPLDPALQRAREGLEYLRRDVADYTAVVVKRELVDGRILGPEKMQLKIRCGRRQDGQITTPFSIYMKFLAPKSRAGREVVWVENKNRGNLVVHESGFKRHLGRISLDPEGFIAMRGQRYPIQCLGFDFLIRELIRRGKRDRKYGDCQVEIDADAELMGRTCTKIEVRHPVRKPHFDFSRARIFVDRELGVPIHYSCYTWPSRDGGRPVLLEEYTYLNVQLNVGLTDLDFDPDNPEYDYP